MSLLYRLFHPHALPTDSASSAPFAADEGFRNEWKYEINWMDILRLRPVLQAVADSDEYAQEDEHGVRNYSIRSLYFDNDRDTALQEKLDGLLEREKFRIRYYNGDTSFIRLEKKYKKGGAGKKFSCALTEEEARKIADGDWDWIADGFFSDREADNPRRVERPLLWELYLKMTQENLRPKTIVDYTREPYVYEPGNVRITFDYDIRTGLRCTDFLNPDCVTVPAGNAPVLMEVKWNHFFPAVIRNAIALPGRQAGAFSKYAQCRVYG